MRKYFVKIFLFCESVLFKYVLRRKFVLFFVLNEIMFSYAFPVLEKLKHDKRLSIWFCFPPNNRFLPENLNMIIKRHKLSVVPYRIAQYFKWDLIIFPDHGGWFRKESKKIYIGHGLNAGKKVEGENYSYGSFSLQNNAILYDKIFEESNYGKAIIKEHYPVFHDRVKVVGSLLADKLCEYTLTKNDTLRTINLDRNKKTIMVASTWGPYSFIQNQGLGLIELIPQLTAKYNIIVAIHQNNFVDKYSAIKWQNIFNQIDCRNAYFPIREEPYRYLAAADLLVTDMTSLGLYYPALLRPMILYDNANMEYVPGALIPELRKTAYVISDVSMLMSAIEKCFNSKLDVGKYQDLIDKTISYAGHAWERYEYEIYDTLSLSLPYDAKSNGPAVD